MAEIISCTNLDATIERYEELGYRLDMICPADDPREAILSVAGGLTSVPVHLVLSDDLVQPPATAGGTDWRVGRAGMMYRDLLDDRMNGRLAISHIRLTEGGEVADYVHYHKVELQMIYCVKGRIKVVYEDQGEPFWLEPGDLVVQPPEIRHRVLECEGGSEVIEISVPAEHETWVDHEMKLPTRQYRPEREFNGQRFFRNNAGQNAHHELNES